MVDIAIVGHDLRGAGTIRLDSGTVVTKPEHFRPTYYNERLAAGPQTRIKESV